VPSYRTIAFVHATFVPLHLVTTSTFVVIFALFVAFAPCYYLSTMPCYYFHTCCPCTFAPCCYLHTCYYLCTLNLDVAFMLIVSFVCAAFMPSHLVTIFMVCALPFHFQIPTAPPPPPTPPFCCFGSLATTFTPCCLVFCVLINTPFEISCVGGGAWNLMQ
jgi:hypothetical protein